MPNHSPCTPMPNHSPCTPMPNFSPSLMPNLSRTCSSGATFDVTEMTPSPPKSVNSKAFESSPDSSMKSGPHKSRRAWGRGGREGWAKNRVS
eukprot:scaffold34431_cov101-Isochrysis_galbana.AAC.1